MPSDSGIGIVGELQDFISQAKHSNIRAFKVVIDKETLKLDGKFERSSSFEDDFDPAVKSFVEDSKPCYIMIKFDRQNSEGHPEWLLLFYCPSSSTVKDKMMYASTRGSFKRDFSSNLITDDLYITRKEDANFQSYADYVKMKDVKTPLTDMELFQEQTKANENIFVGVDSTGSNLPAMHLNVNADVTQALDDFYHDKSNYIQLSIDVNTEKTNLIENKNINLDDLSKYSCENEPRFHLFRFDYTYEGDEKKVKIFIYTIPGFKCPIKQRMVYSSCKGFVMQLYETERSVFDKKIETENLKEITEEFLMNELHPQKAAQNVGFSKPKKPGRR